MTTMTTNSVSWYIPGEGKKPVGPFTAEQVIESWRAGRLSEKTLCWREGMAKWLPLTQVEPFAIAIRSAAATPSAAPHQSGVLRRLAARLVVLAFLGVAGGAGYIYWSEWDTIHKANAMIVANDYEEAISILRSFRNETYFYRGETSYLTALAATRQYAAATTTEDLAEDALKKPAKQFQELFQAGESWRERARTELADIIGSVSKKAPDRLKRCEAITGFMEKLKLADAKELGRNLLDALKSHTDDRGGSDNVPATFVAQIVRLDPALASGVLAAVSSSNGNSPQSLHAVPQWAREQPSLARPLGDALMEKADDFSRESKPQWAEAALDSAEETYPQLRDRCARKRLAWFASRLDDTDYAGVVRGLDGMRLERYSPEIADKAAELYLQVAQGACKANPAVAQRALDKAFHVQPSLAASEPNAWLRIELHPEWSEDKVAWCNAFLTQFPSSEHRDDVQRLAKAPGKPPKGPHEPPPVPPVKPLETLEDKLTRRKRHHLHVNRDLQRH